jgi:hypothetical protein
LEFLEQVVQLIPHGEVEAVDELDQLLVNNSKSPMKLAVKNNISSQSVGNY